MLKLLKQHQKSQYLVSLGAECPFCKADLSQVTSNSPSFIERGVVRFKLTCPKCGEELIEEFCLAEVYTPDEFKPYDASQDPDADPAYKETDGEA
jgi:predicted RNA-binding Zn-ribbon protein involved in translation (DUF1610 family)